MLRILWGFWGSEDMAIQLILCVETNKRADTDSIYIAETINHWYTVNNQTKISKIYMNTKSKYNSKGVLREIDKKSKAFVMGKTKVIYCIDTDQYESDMEQARELNSIIEYCKEKNCDVIWFCHDIEEVFLGKKISDSQKVRAAAFRRKKKIEEIQDNKLSYNEKCAYTSNILSVLDKYLPRKYT